MKVDSIDQTLDQRFPNYGSRPISGMSVISVGRESHSKFELLHALSQIISKWINLLNRCLFLLYFFPSTSKYMQNNVGPENLCFEEWVVTYKVWEPLH